MTQLALLLWASSFDKINLTYYLHSKDLKTFLKTRLIMKPGTCKITILLFFCFSTLILSAQQIASINIRKGIEEIRKKPRLEVEVHVPMDMTDFAVDNPIDFEQTNIEVFADDTGKDFAGIFDQKQEEKRNEGYSTGETLLTFGGVANYRTGQDFMVIFNVPAAPDPEARSIRIKGNLVVNFISQGEGTTAVIKGVPVEMPYDSDGHPTDIGLVRIEGRGSASLKDGKYRKFVAVSADSPITTVEVIGGDDRGAVKGIWSVAENAFVFKDVPETVDLKVNYSKLEKKEIPLDLEFGVGL